MALKKTRLQVFSIYLMLPLPSTSVIDRFQGATPRIWSEMSRGHERNAKWIILHKK